MCLQMTVGSFVMKTNYRSQETKKKTSKSTLAFRAPTQVTAAVLQARDNYHS